MKTLNLHYETTKQLLRKILDDIMQNSIFDTFTLVGGTSLSLRLGHRKSDDIDLFTNAPYGSLDFSVFENYFQNNYDYFDCSDTTGIVGFGRTYYVGNSENESIKVDLYYNDTMIDPLDIFDGIRMASIKDVTAMKIEVISNKGRKKDFWDLHELLNIFSVMDMLELHKSRYEYSHDRDRIITNFSDYSMADEDPDPICMKGKVWELIKLDFVELLNDYLGKPLKR